MSGDNEVSGRIDNEVEQHLEPQKTKDSDSMSSGSSPDGAHLEPKETKTSDDLPSGASLEDTHLEPQETKTSDVCANCGFPISDGQDSCPKCGTRKGTSSTRHCKKCGAELQDGVGFCSNCGQKVDAEPDRPHVNISKNVGGASETGKGKMKLGIIIGVAAAVVIAAVIVFTAFGTGGKVDFKKQFSQYSGKSWCNFAPDGTWMEIDTNPNDIDSDSYKFDYTAMSEANDAIEKINADLGFSSSVQKKMNSTTAMQGRQSDSNDKFSVSWSYHPDSGLEFMYEMKH